MIQEEIPVIGEMSQKWGPVPDYDHFALKDIFHSNLAREENIENLPDEEQFRNAVRTLSIVDSIRFWLDVPVTISSGFRGPALNARVGGKADSYHQRGLAADLVSSRMTTQTMMEGIVAMCDDDDYTDIASEIRKVIYEIKKKTTWVHISVFAPDAERTDTRFYIYRNGVYRTYSGYAA